MSTRKEDADKIIKDFNSIASKNARQSSRDNKDNQKRTEVKSSRHNKDEDENHDNKRHDNKKEDNRKQDNRKDDGRDDGRDDEKDTGRKGSRSNMKLIIIIAIIVLYCYMSMGSKIKLIKKPLAGQGIPTPVANVVPPVQSTSQ